ncbi:hypothetical protein [Echinicola salinicaeni]|uniref:hypothetical protein n=1 Tax=Echinicola salinicaeni TaxID=2762757 RepID=UPI0016455620|nr:hypothetical protein [Echinicola salinicaeni]
MKRSILSLYFILQFAYLVNPGEVFAQNCNQNNLNIQSIDFYDTNGAPFDPDAEFDHGTEVDGQIFVTYGGSSTNAYSLHFSYDIYINGTFSESVVLCLFPGQNVIKGVPQYINDFTLNWGDRIEFRNIFMRWYTNSGNSECPTQEGSNAQCYANLDGFVVNTPLIVLPVAWHNISAASDTESKKVILNWSTLKEWETSHFELERSINGIENFTTIANIAALGWSSELTEYKYEDNQISNLDGLIYYRIKQVDLDGNFEYSQTFSIRLGDFDLTHRSWRFYPNPSTGNQLKIKLIDRKNYKDGPIHLTITSNHNMFKYTLKGGIDFYEADISPLISDLPNGLIILRVNWANKSESFKIIKK